MDMLPTLDAEVFYELRDSVARKPGTLAALYATFFSNAVRLIGAVAAAESVETREKSLHALKGSAGMMDAARMARLAGDLQEVCARCRFTPCGPASHSCSSSWRWFVVTPIRCCARRCVDGIADPLFPRRGLVDS